MKRNNILAILALSVFMVPVAGAMSHSGTVSDWFGVEVADTVLTDTGVQVTELSDSMKSVLEPQKRTLTGTELLPDSTGNVLPDSTANVQKRTQTDGKKYGTVKGVVSYSNGEGIVNAKLEFASETDTILTTSLADGTFSIELLEGKYDLYVSYQEEKIKPIDVKVKAGKTEEISKKKLEFDAKLLQDVEVTAERGCRYFSAHICNLAKYPLANAVMYVYNLPDTVTPLKVLYSNTEGNFADSLVLGNYILRPAYLDKKLGDINLTVTNEDVNIDTIVVDNIKHLRLGNPMSVEARNAFISLYKKGIGSDISAENYNRAYDHWRTAFCARPDRYLVQYLDGITILNASIAADTIQKRYDRIKYFNEELMDLFELAIINIDSLNAQIVGEDTLTVAQLRAQQIEYYKINWQMDTVFKTPEFKKGDYKLKGLVFFTNIDSVKPTDWEVEFFKDSVRNIELYNMARPFITSENTNLFMKDIDAFRFILHFKANDEIARLNSREKAKSIVIKDKELMEAKASELNFLKNPKDEGFAGFYDRFVKKTPDIEKFFIGSVEDMLAYYKALPNSKDNILAAVNDEMLNGRRARNNYEVQVYLDTKLRELLGEYEKENKPDSVFITRLAIIDKAKSIRNNKGLAMEHRKRYNILWRDRVNALMKDYGKELTRAQKASNYIALAEYNQFYKVDSASSYSQGQIAGYEHRYNLYNDSAAMFGYPLKAVEEAIDIYSYATGEGKNKGDDYYWYLSLAYNKLNDAISKVEDWNKDPNVPELNISLEKLKEYRDKGCARYFITLDEAFSRGFSKSNTNASGSYRVSNKIKNLSVKVKEGERTYSTRLYIK